jgi:hypothetical protein
MKLKVASGFRGGEGCRPFVRFEYRRRKRQRHSKIVPVNHLFHYFFGITANADPSSFDGFCRSVAHTRDRAGGIVGAVHLIREKGAKLQGLLAGFVRHGPKAALHNCAGKQRLTEGRREMELHAHGSGRLAEYCNALGVNAQGGGVGVQPLHDGALVAKLLVAVQTLEERR